VHGYLFLCFQIRVLGHGHLLLGLLLALQTMMIMRMVVLMLLLLLCPVALPLAGGTMAAPAASLILLR
jgi:hypothetical protein